MSALPFASVVGSVFRMESVWHCFSLCCIWISVFPELEGPHPSRSWMGFGAGPGPGPCPPARPPGYKSCSARSRSRAEAEWSPRGGNAVLTFLGFWATQIYHPQHFLPSGLLINVFLKDLRILKSLFIIFLISSVSI